MDRVPSFVLSELWATLTNAYVSKAAAFAAVSSDQYTTSSQKILFVTNTLAGQAIVQQAVTVLCTWKAHKECQIEHRGPRSFRTVMRELSQDVASLRQPLREANDQHQLAERIQIATAKERVRSVLCISSEH